MSFRDLHLKKSYSSDEEDILNDFYIPTLSNTIRYDRLAGFFSSTVLSIAAKGIIQLIKNNGKMRLVVSPRLSKEDIKSILDSDLDEKDVIEQSLLSELDDLELENLFVQDHVKALSWMLVNGFLELKVALVRQLSGSLMTIEQIQNNAIFHQKVGILEDKAGDILTFSGSVNETKSAWLKHIEEFKVFRGWVDEEIGFVDPDIRKFNRFWTNNAKNVTVIELPVAVKAKLIKFSPKTIESLKLGRWYQEYKTTNKIKLYTHQQHAVQKWIANGMKGIFSMATGSGKTFAAIECLRILIEHYQPIFAVIACPNNPLITQWRNEITKYGIKSPIMIADSSIRNWKKILSNSLVDFHVGNKTSLIVISTHASFASDDFNLILNQNLTDKINSFIIGDEVHRLGSPTRSNKISDKFIYRLGLSATPDRGIFDRSGTKKIYDYFGNTIYQFTLGDGITRINPITGKSYLTPFRYLPIFVKLNNEEVDSYRSITNEINSLISKSNNKDEDLFDKEQIKYLLFKRADIIKNANNKLPILEQLLKNLVAETIDLKWLLVYTTEKQIDQAVIILKKMNLTTHRFTMEEDIKPNPRFNGISERDYILQNFKEGNYDSLVAMKCLDEGVDIPPAKYTFLLASSGSEREYIQRIGRVIRRYPGKQEAIIYDFVVIPPLDSLPKELKYLESKIMRSEFERYEKIVQYAVNSAEALTKLYKIKRKYEGD